jgi:hypothetical protein
MKSTVGCETARKMESGILVGPGLAKNSRPRAGFVADVLVMQLPPTVFSAERPRYGERADLDSHKPIESFRLC